LKTHHGFERVRLRGLSGARDEFHLAAIVQTLKTMALATAAGTITDGFLAGVDHSNVMLRIARSRSAGLLRSGRMELTLGDSEHIPYPDGRFNKAFTVHTIYFWSDPKRQIEEISRVMSNEARLVIGYRPSDDGGLVSEFPTSIYAIRQSRKWKAWSRRRD